VIADEAHRSQYGSARHPYLKQMRLPPFHLCRTL
jgi:hypothetical protein